MDPTALSCIICKTDLIIKGGQSNKHTSAIVCGHVFHTACLKAWLRRNPSCPNCRHPIKDEGDIINKLYFDEDKADSDDVGPSTSQMDEDGCQGLGTFGGGMLVGAILTGLAVGIGYLFSGGINKRKK